MSDLGWLELFFDGMVGDDPGYNEVEWAVEEIKRLTVENEQLRARWEWLKDKPNDARHLLLLLIDKKGTGKDFDKMIDRIVASINKNLAQCGST